MHACMHTYIHTYIDRQTDGLTVVCKGDQYFDQNTGNCDPCAPLCAIINCSIICPNYQIPPVSSMQQSAGSVSSSSFINEYLPIILPVIACAVIISALVGFIFYQHHQTARWCPMNREIPVTTHAVQATEVDSDRIPMNTNTDEFFNV
ncbi:hypothetical protein ACJMK2_009099 [Sinanodonta woodiana]|uniref:Uncharacterized protein n=1 Tax=Sinanodonta woodiana TaxID=1069815 RepID=A0ABD3VB86_SINWO